MFSMCLFDAVIFNNLVKRPPPPPTPLPTLPPPSPFVVVIHQGVFSHACIHGPQHRARHDKVRTFVNFCNPKCRGECSTARVKTHTRVTTRRQCKGRCHRHTAHDAPALFSQPSDNVTLDFTPVKKKKSCYRMTLLANLQLLLYHKSIIFP